MGMGMAGQGVVMAKGKVPVHSVTARSVAAPPEASLADNFSGQNSVAALIAAQADVPARSRVRRIFGASPLNSHTRTLFDCALADAIVGDILDGLGPEWVTVHAVPVSPDGTTLDHLVAGPGGVFIVETRSHSRADVWASQRTFMVSGIRFPYIRNMEYEMGRVERLLGTAISSPVEVSGVLAVVDPKSLTVRHKHRDVSVISSADLAHWLTDQRRVLSVGDVGRIARAAQNPGSWSSVSESVVDRVGLCEQFVSLRNSVRSAWRVQLVWVSVVTVVGAGGFMLLSWLIMANALAAFGG
jgi:hypothetical protein